MTSLTVFPFRNEADANRIRALLKQLPREPNAVDYEEYLGMESLRAETRLWQVDDQLVAFAYADAYNNLHFEIHPDHVSDELELAIVDWGLACVRKRNAEIGAQSTLDYSCNADDRDRLAFTERFGFARESIRSLSYVRSLEEPIDTFPLPQGFSVRCATGENEIDALVALHRAAFGTDHMTIEERLAIMRAPGYIPELDLVSVAPDGELCAFCICELDTDDSSIGHTDPIGTHPHYQRIGLGKAIVSEGLSALQSRSAQIVKLGTSSENIPMQKLAEQMGFTCVAERFWFSKIVPPKE